MVGATIGTHQPSDLLGNRFLSKSARIFLDTKPGLVPEVTSEVPQAFVRYLRLSPYQLHIPQVYEVLPPQPGVDLPTVLLDQAAVYVPPNSADVQVLPALEELWQSAGALRQLNWLSQMAHLWQPLSLEQSVSSLLLPELLRVEGPLVRLLELRVDPAGAQSAPSLAQLGQQWGKWVPMAHPTIAAFLELLCQHMIQGEIRSAEQLIAAIDQGLVELGQRQIRQIHIATGTDQGPTRPRNEDACYPDSGTVKTQTISANQTAADPAVVIVCDGIGGHQGGNVASHLAISAVQERLQLLHPEQLDAVTLTTELEQAVWAANDRISERNDSEQRFDRQRMGTTLVMGLVRGHELYTTHVGDSRAYWITRWNCRQVTLDDDIATREVRLGYSSYREALQQPGAGSLVQALGMGSSSVLHPSIQRFVLDEDCVFLLCSDGLSDGDRVEECWETEILPLLSGKVDVATACQRLVTIANTRNGHDNVTVGLMHCQVTEQPNSEPLVALETASSQANAQAKTVSVQAQEALPSEPYLPVPTLQPGRATASTLKTQIVEADRPKSSLLPLLLSILLLLGLGGLLTYFLFPSVSAWIDPRLGLNPRPAVEPAMTPLPTASGPASGTPSGTTSPPQAATPLQIGAFIQTGNGSSASPNAASPTATTLLPQPIADRSRPVQTGTAIPAGSVLRVMRRQSTGQTRWVQVQVCSIPSAGSAAPVASPVASAATPMAPSGSPTAASAPMPATPPAAPIAPGTLGWVEESAVVSQARSGAQLSATQRGNCPLSAAPPPSPAVPSVAPALPVPPPAN